MNEKYTFTMPRDQAIKDAVETLEKAFKIGRAELLHALDAQCVKHGRWESPVSVGNGIKFCSVCRNEAYWDTDYGQQLFDYCPYCGARMDGDTNE